MDQTPIVKLIQGFRSFRLMHYERRPELFAELAHGQAPKIMMIACCDARVDPAIITDCNPGDLFVVRNVANLVPPYERSGAHHGTSAALEFAVETLQVEHIIVFGHAQCGGIRALLRESDEDSTRPGFIHAWMDIARRARKRVLTELPNADEATRAHACECEAIKVSLENLLSFPWITERVQNDRLMLHGWYFDLDRGELLGYRAEHDDFQPLA